MVQNLTKENFFDELRERFPNAVDHFCKWIDDYKVDNNWLAIFGPDVKFHHLPFEMQNGIISRYELELHNNTDGRGKNIYENIGEEYKMAIRDIFQDLEKIMQREIQLEN
jgi:hypothetical protein